MIDTNITDLRIIPASHLALQDIDNVLEIKKENKLLKTAMIIGIAIGFFLMIYHKNKEEHDVRKK